MLDFWLKLKLWTEYIIPASIIVILVAATVLYAAISTFRWNRKIKLLKRNGFEQYLSSVSSVGGRAFYARKNGETGKRIDECDLKRWGYRELRNIIKG